MDGLFLPSSAGFKINIARFTLDGSLGLKNIGLSGSVEKGNIIKSYGLTANPLEFKVLGVEWSTTVQRDAYTSQTTYTNVSLTGWVAVAALIYAATGQWVTMDQMEQMGPAWGWGE